MDSFLMRFSFCCLVLSTDAAVAVPIVTLSPGTTVYVNNGSSLNLTCGVDENLGTYFVYFSKNSIDRVFIYDVPNCAYAVLINNETNAFNVSSNGMKSFTILQKTVSVGDHVAQWRCFLTSSEGTGPCANSPNPCTSLGVTIFVRVPVTRVQLTDGTGNLLHSPVAVAIGTSAIIRCNNSPKGSRPGAIFHWYKRHENQSDMLIENQFISSTPEPERVPGQTWQDLLISYSTLSLTGNRSFQNMYIFCAAQNEANSGPELQSAEIQLNILYPPIVSLNSNNSVYIVTEGKENFILVCDILDANPQPQADAFIWRHQGTVLQGQTSASYVIQSIQKSDDGQYQCSASNPYGTGISSIMDLNVQYAPDVRVNISGYTVIGSTSVLMCVPQGNPPQYTFHPWIHRVGQTEIRRLDGVNTVSLSTLSLSNISIQDMGTYICTVDNSITGLDGQINQLGDTHVYVQGPSFIGEMQSTFTWETNKSTSIEIPFHSNSSIRILKFIRLLDSFEIYNTSDVSIYIKPSNITMMFYMKKVIIPGHVAVLHFRNLINTDFGNYSLQLTNDQGTVSVQFELIVSAPPSVPSKFFFSHIEDSLLVFGIEKGFNGGSDQTFVVEYQPLGMPEATWSTVFKINENNLDDPLTNGTYYIKIPKIQDGQYVFRVYAENRKGNSSALEGVHVEIKTAVPSPVVGDFPVGAVAGGVVGAIMVVIAIVVVAVVKKRWTLKTKMEKNMKRVVFDSKSPEYVNTAFNTTEYEALQSGQTGSSQYEALNDLKSTDVSISPDPRPSVGQMLYDELQPCDINQGHMYSSLSSPGPDEGENKFYENTVKVS